MIEKYGSAATDRSIGNNEIVGTDDEKDISERIEVLGPSPCVIERINGQYRFQLLIKNKMGAKGHKFISSFLNKIIMPKDIKLAIDVDPLDIL